MFSDVRHSYIHKYESNASMLSQVIVYLKSVNFLFLFSIYTNLLHVPDMKFRENDLILPSKVMICVNRNYINRCKT